MKLYLIQKEKSSWDLAIQHASPEYRALHADDFFTVSGHGVTEKTRSETDALDANVTFEQCDLSEFNVVFVSEGTALITYRVKARGLDRGKPFAMDSYASALWVKRGGKWLNIFYQATPSELK